MANLILPTVRTTQPQALGPLNLSNPLTKNLVWAIAPAISNIDYVRNRPFVLVKSGGTTRTPSNVITKQGRALLTSEWCIAGNTFNSHDPIAASNSVTVLSIAVNTTSSYNRPLFTRGNDSSGGWSITLSHNSTGTISFAVVTTVPSAVQYRPLPYPQFHLLQQIFLLW